MSNILLIGKDLPDGIDFAESLAGTDNTIFTSAKSVSDVNSFESERIYACIWNRSSAVSAHSLMINAETKLENFDHVIFYFDTTYYCSKFELDKTEEISAAVDTMMNSYFNAAGELIKRADQKKEKLTVSFLIRTYPSKNEIALSGSKTSGMVPASIIVSTAEAAFTALAENFATYVADRDYLSVILAKCTYTNELYKNERAIASWLKEAYSTVTNSKNKQSIKNACNWNKAGGKISIGFSLFK